MTKRGRPKALDETARREICLLIQNGHSLANVARSIGCATNTIRNAAARDPQFRGELEAACRHARLYRVTRILWKSGSPALLRCSRDLDDARRWEERRELALQQAAEKERRRMEKRERKREPGRSKGSGVSVGNPLSPGKTVSATPTPDPFSIPTAEHVRMIGDFLLTPGHKLGEENPPFEDFDPTSPDFSPANLGQKMQQVQQVQKISRRNTRGGRESFSPIAA